MNVITYNLKPFDEVFRNLNEQTEEEMEEETAPFDLDALNEILNELQMFNLNSGQDYVSQIKRVAGIDTVAADIALKYLEIAESEFKE